MILGYFTDQSFNSSPPSATDMHQWNGSALIQVMGWRQIGDNPLPEPMLTYVNWKLRNKLQWNSNQTTKVFTNENTFKTAKWQPFCSGGDGLTGNSTEAIFLQTNILAAAKADILFELCQYTGYRCLDSLFLQIFGIHGIDYYHDF